MFNVVGFDIEVVEVAAEVEEVVDGSTGEVGFREEPASARCAVVPVVDGRRIESDVFDAEGVLARGAEDGRLDIFTCSCGVAGCAGIHVEAKIELREGAVAWVFPEDPFRARFSEFFAPGEPLEFVFELGQYRQELAALMEAVERLRAASAARFFVEPCGSFGNEDWSVPFPEQVAKRRLARRRWDKERERLGRAEGGLRRLEAKVEVAGSKLSAGLAHLAWSAMPGGMVGEEALEHLAKVLRPAMLSDPVGWVKAWDASVGEGVFWVDSAPPGSDWAEVAAAWGSAKVEVVEVDPDPWE